MKPIVFNWIFRVADIRGKQISEIIDDELQEHCLSINKMDSVEYEMKNGYIRAIAKYTYKNDEEALMHSTTVVDGENKDSTEDLQKALGNILNWYKDGKA